MKSKKTDIFRKFPGNRPERILQRKMFGVHGNRLKEILNKTIAQAVRKSNIKYEDERITTECFLSSVTKTFRFYADSEKDVHF